MASQTSFVVLQAGGTVANKKGTSPVSVDSLKAMLRRKEAPTLIGQYKAPGAGSKTWLALFAYTTGKAGTENKHDLPPPHDEILLFGDAFVAAFSDKALKHSEPFNTDQFAEFYDKAFGGFEDLDETDDVAEGDGEDADDSTYNTEESEDDDDDDDEVDEEGDEDGDGEDLEDGAAKAHAVGLLTEPVYTGPYGAEAGDVCHAEEYSYPPDYKKTE